MGYFRFFLTHFGLFTALYPTLCIKKNLQKNSLSYYLLEVKNIHGDNVKNESARAKKNLRGGGAKRSPPACWFQYSKYSYHNDKSSHLWSNIVKIYKYVSCCRLTGFWKRERKLTNYCHLHVMPPIEQSLKKTIENKINLCWIWKDRWREETEIFKNV